MQELVQQRVDAIIRVIVDRINPSLDASSLSSETRLVKGGLALDSMAVLELVTGLEDELGILIDESELKLEVLDDIGSLARFLGDVPIVLLPRLAAGEAIWRAAPDLLGALGLTEL